jgi:hypothetical protein
VPGGHEYGERTFIYETDLMDGERVAEAMERRLPPEHTRRVPVTDLPTLSALLDRAEAGEVLHLVPPGAEGGFVLVHESPR